MEAVKRGGDRQKLHEIIRKCSMEEIKKMRNGEEWDLLSKLAKEKAFGLTKEEIQNLLEPSLYIGRCPEQVESLINKLSPYLKDIDRTPVQIEI